jgi:hypothetical protein
VQRGPWASPSTLDRVIACPASAALPQGPDVTGPSAAWGKEVHAFKEGREPTPRVKSWYEKNYQPGYRETLWPGGVHEVQLFEDQGGFVTRLGGVVDFPDRVKYRREGMFFTLDYLNMDDGPLPWIDDLKTGMMPQSWTQLKAYTWGLYSVHPEIQASLASYTNWTRYPLGAEAVRQTQVYHRSEIEAWHESVIIPAKRLALGHKAAKLVNPGDHCRWCRCKPYCPAWADNQSPEYPREDNAESET